jgi:flagellar biosynthesis/type III secretory pathway protein FliH
MQRQRIATALEALQTVAAQLQATRSEILARAESQLLDLAIDIARKAMMQEIQAGRHQIEPLLKEALLRVPSRQDVVVYLNPDDLAQCPMAQAAEQAQNTGMRFMADPMVRPGQCLVETARGAVISSFEDRLDDLADALKSPEQA